MDANGQRVRSWFGGVFRQWRRARDEAKQATWSRREHREADELQRAREGVDRFPRGGG